MSGKCVDCISKKVSLILAAKVLGLESIQVLRNTMGDVYNFQKKSVTKAYNSTLYALRGGGGCQISGEKHCVTFEFPLVHNYRHL